MLMKIKPKEKPEKDLKQTKKKTQAKKKIQKKTLKFSTLEKSQLLECQITDLCKNIITFLPIDIINWNITFFSEQNN